MFGQNKHPEARNFRLSLVDDVTHNHLWTLHFTRQGYLVTVISVIVVLFAIVYCLFAYTPLRTAIPGYPDAFSKRAAIENAIKIDSLETVIKRWELYSENMLRVIEGREPVPADSIVALADAVEKQAKDPVWLSKQDSLLRDIVNKEEQFGVTDNQERKLPIEGVHFFTPLKGVVSTSYDQVLHPYVDITAPANSVVMSALSGTVIFDGWNDESGYTIAIQHESDIVTVYKHNQKLLKKTGDVVSAGTSIGLVGGSIEAGDHLHFELWYKGEAVDPAKYINF